MIQIIFKKNDNTVCIDENNKYYIDYNNGWSREYPIHYGKGKFAYDFPERIPKYLKNEYQNHFDKVNELKEQLSKYFDTSALKLPKAVDYPGADLSL